jgi:membrane associated rhomboid family serine protease
LKLTSISFPSLFGQAEDTNMFIPLHDDTPLRMIRFQFVTLTIIVLNFVVFFLTYLWVSPTLSDNFAIGFGIIPHELFQGGGSFNPVPEPLTLVTSLFMHGDWMHIIGNMLFLWVFADNVEDAYGYFGFIMFYALCGLVAGMTHALVLSQSFSPLIGASGAVSGVLASYLVLYPRARIWVLLFLRLPVPLPAIWVLSGWFLLQVYGLAAAQPGDDIAWWDHLGGFGCGLVLTLLLRKRLLNLSNGRI